MSKKISPATGIFSAKGADGVYRAIVSRLRDRVGSRHVIEDLKQTCVHLIAAAGGAAYAGLHPRKGAVLLNIRLQSPLKSRRVRKVEQVSRNRYHCELLLSTEAEVDDEVIAWLETASALMSDSGVGGNAE